MQLINVKINETLSKCHDFSAFVIFILLISFLTIPGAGHLPAHVSPKPWEFANFILKNANAGGLARRGGDGHWWN